MPHYGTCGPEGVRNRQRNEGATMKFVRRAGLAVAAAAISVGLLGAAAGSAHADTSWGQKKRIAVVQTAPIQSEPLDTSWGQD